MVPTIPATPFALIDSPAKLGESIVGMPDRLIQVSIPDGKLISIDPHRGTAVVCCESSEQGISFGSAVPAMNGALLLFESVGLRKIDQESGLELKRFGLPKIEYGKFADPDPNERVRFNDSKVGPQGRVYVGVIFDVSETRKARVGQACIVSFGADHQWRLCISGLTTPNGGCWDDVSADSATFYLSDTPTFRLNVYRHNLSSDDFSLQRSIDLSAATWGEDPKTWGRPDGMTIGSIDGTDSILLVAMFEGGKVLLLDPHNSGTAALRAIITVPVPKVTSVALHGSRAFITSGRGDDIGGETYVADLSGLAISERPLPCAKL